MGEPIASQSQWRSRPTTGIRRRDRSRAVRLDAEAKRHGRKRNGFKADRLTVAVDQGGSGRREGGG